MKRGVFLLVLFVILNLVIVSASCGDGVCETKEKNSNAIGVFCPQDCEGGSKGRCYTDLDCQIGFVCSEDNVCEDPTGSLGKMLLSSAPEEVKVQVQEKQEGAQQKQEQGAQQQEQKTLACSPTPYLDYNAARGVYILDDGVNYLEIQVGVDEITFSSLEDVLIYSTKENSFSSELVLQKTTGSRYNILDSNLIVLGNLDLATYGLPLANVLDEIIYTYSFDPINFIFGDYYLTVTNQNKFLACQLQEILPECSDRKDNNGNGRVDYTGGCDIDADGSLDQLCWCDYDASGDVAFNEYVGIELCEGFDYYCEDTEGNIYSDCKGDYYYYEEACLSADDSEGSGSCTETNLEAMGALCLDAYPDYLDVLLCIEENAIEMDLICETMFGEEEIESCLVHEDCEEGQVCDSEFLTCVDIEIKVEQEELDPCKENLDCKKGFLCEENYCVKDPTGSGIITGDNPFLSPLKNGLDEVAAFVNQNDPEFLAKQAANKNRELLELEKRKEVIPEDKFNQVKEETLEFSAKRLNQATEVLEKNVHNSEVSELVLQRNMLQLENIVKGVGNTLEDNGVTLNQFKQRLNVQEDSVVGLRVQERLEEVESEKLTQALPEENRERLQILQERDSREETSETILAREKIVEEVTEEEGLQKEELRKLPSGIRVQESSQTLRLSQQALNEEREAEGLTSLRERTQEEETIVNRIVTGTRELTGTREAVTTSTRELTGTRDTTTTKDSSTTETRELTGTREAVTTSTRELTGTRDATTTRDSTTETRDTLAFTRTQTETGERTQTNTLPTRVTRESGTVTFEARATNPLLVTRTTTTSTSSETEASSTAKTTTNTRPAQRQALTPAQIAKRKANLEKYGPLTGAVIGELREDNFNIFEFILTHDW